ncbi:sugar phosphate isomerase/epimerase family protein [Anaeromicrobium sediminis]|uniref:AP endonuclease n=1 Tax=Anaeromicrobium sediminis TaxID=1478221 RepID=A0A267MK46_9FIRM|nr:TIM barrel protein [Anaeromicrobium sediminis]PAB59288.1 AP endonuclease [Anaeromicrobium sediminis]
MSFKIGSAPCSWGVEDANDPHNPAWEKVLDEASQAGYKGLELGPYGYLPQDVELLQNALAQRDLQIVAGTLYDDLVSPENFQNIISKTHVTCKLISKLPKASQVDGQSYATPYLVIIDQVNKVRSPFAGHPDKAPRLSTDDWNQMMKHIREIGKITSEEYGIRSVVHPHAGGYIEYADETIRLLNDIPSEVAGLCLDTGHLYYACMDPVQWLKKYADRLDYVHFKDIDIAVYKNVINRQIGFFEACKENVMCPIGKGIIDYEAIHKTLHEIKYKGWITIEQERDPRDADGSLADVRESLKYLEKIGY